MKRRPLIFNTVPRCLGYFFCLGILVVCTSCSDETEDNTVNDPDQSSKGAEGKSDEPPVDRSQHVLRHAVFFKFKESAGQQKVQEIVDAFRALPSKIDAIIDFQWGVNNSPEGKNDGLTHCFLLTFKDEKGREVYLPHPAHKEFGKVLGGHNEKVFVIDYWGTPQKKQKNALEKELKHAVFLKFKDDAAADEVKAVENAFAALPSTIDAIKAFEWGKNNSPERHSQGFTHCFMVSFDSEEGRAAYLPHPEHEAFVKLLKPVLDKVRVIDFWAQK